MPLFKGTASRILVGIVCSSKVIYESLVHLQAVAEPFLQTLWEGSFEEVSGEQEN